MLLSLSNSASVFSCSFSLWFDLLVEFMGAYWFEQPRRIDSSTMFAISFMVFQSIKVLLSNCTRKQSIFVQDKVAFCFLF